MGTQPLIGRLVTTERRKKSTKAEWRRAERMLHRALTRDWPEGPQQVHSFITPGGFVSVDGVDAAEHGQCGWESRKKDIVPYAEAAEDPLSVLLSNRVMQAARKRARVLTIGIDAEYEDDEWWENAELVAVIDTTTGGVVRWTGKSYPVQYQQHSLVHVTDLKSHLVRLHGERLLVLGCHDLNMFSGRARANQRPDGPLRARSDEMIALAKKFKPTLVLQHPHTADTWRTWSVPWGGVRKHLGDTVKAYASGFSHYLSEDEEPRAPLEDCLRLTCSGPETCIDIVGEG